MNCLNCGRWMSSHVDICSHCGTSQRAYAADPPPRWENCVIGAPMRDMGWHYEDGRPIYHTPMWTFAAYDEAGPINARGRFAEASEWFEWGSSMSGGVSVPNRGCEGGQRILDEFIQELISDGWEPVRSHGPNWFSYRFRRSAG